MSGQSGMPSSGRRSREHANRAPILILGEAPDGDGASPANDSRSPMGRRPSGTPRPALCPPWRGAWSIGMLSLAAIEQFRALSTARGPLLVASDLDGTLAPIVGQAADARVPPGTLTALERLATVAKVAVITGRDLNTARRMVPSDLVIIVASHGLETSIDSDLIPGVDRVAVGAALERIEQRVMSRVPAAYLQVERKAISTAFHYRQREDLEVQLRDALRDLPDGLRLREGRMVLEVLPDARSGKDLALAALARHFRVRSMLVIGDDATDAAMFRTALDLARDGVHVLLAGVSGGRETPSEIADLSDVLLQSPDEVREALETVARAVGA
nr:putative trehalose-phosphatase [uncultured bacterium]